jgi:hypothetical protein
MSEEIKNTKSWWEILTALTPLILGICVTGVGAFFTQVYNYRQLQLNQLAALDKLRPQLISENAYDREFAYASFTALGYEDLALKLMQLKQDTAGRTVAQEIQSGATGTAKAEASATLLALPVHVYIHIANENQRSKADAVRTTLEEKGYVVPGIENVAGKAELPKKTNVRYFNDQDKPIADAIVAALKEQGVASAYAYRVSRYKVKPGSLEIWFSPDAA